MQLRIHILILGLIFSFMACKEVPSHPLIVPAVFTDRMVLQRETDVKFWGSFTPGE